MPADSVVRSRAAGRPRAGSMTEHRFFGAGADLTARLVQFARPTTPEMAFRHEMDNAGVTFLPARPRAASSWGPSTAHPGTAAGLIEVGRISAESFAQGGLSLQIGLYAETLGALPVSWCDEPIKEVVVAGPYDEPWGDPFADLDPSRSGARPAHVWRRLADGCACPSSPWGSGCHRSGSPARGPHRFEGRITLAGIIVGDRPTSTLVFMENMSAPRSAQRGRRLCRARRRRHTPPQRHRLDWQAL